MTIIEENQRGPTLHTHFQKKWIVYNKETVVEKLNDSLDAILKYFKACFDGNLKITTNLHMNEYIQSRFQNVHNLLASLMFNDEITFEEYHDWMKNHEMIEEEFAKLPHEINITERADKLQKYIDSVTELSIYQDEESSDNEDEILDDENEISDLEEDQIPDTASIINVNSDCKKRKK